MTARALGLAAGLWLAAAILLLAGAPPFARAIVGVPAILWAPGLGWAVWIAGRPGARPRDALALGLDAAWIALFLAVVEVSVVREAGLAPGWLLPLAVLAGLPGFGLAARRPTPTAGLDRTARAGIAILVVAVAGLGIARRADLTRPLDAFWWDARAESLGEPVPIQATGFRPEPDGSPSTAALVRDVEGGAVTVEAIEAGRLCVLARGPVGLEAALAQGAVVIDAARVERDPVEDPAEGPVPRYLGAGTVALCGDVAAGSVEIRASGPARLRILPGVDALWATHASGAARYVHYWQILNLVENQRWAAEVLTERRATFHQPPLWSYALAVPVALGAPDLPGAGALLLWVLLLVGASTLHLARVAAPGLRPAAALLPALAAIQHGRMMIEPGSVGFPDSLYAAALAGGVAAALESAWSRAGLLALASSLLRYPGLFVVGLASLLPALGRRAVGPLLRGLAPGAVLLALLAVGLGLSGRFREFLGALWFEILPEHWHGEHDPALLLARAPRFYALWIGYAGATPLIAAALARGRALLPLAVAAAYSLLLCTIDHFPTHYFLPLVHLAVASAAAATALPGRRGTVALALATAGLWITLAAMPSL